MNNSADKEVGSRGKVNADEPPNSWGRMGNDKTPTSSSRPITDSCMHQTDDMLSDTAAVQPQIAPCSAESNNRTSVANMLHRVAASEAHFKHQQRDQPDLTLQQKLQIAKDIFENNPSTFLSRFGKYLQEIDLDIFEPLRNDYVVGFYLNDIRKRLNDRTNHMTTRNRRFEAMKKMMSHGDYFEEDSMKSRDPLLYEQMVGQYLTEEQVHTHVENKDLGFASVLLEHVQSLQDNELYDRLHDTEEGQKEEEDSSDEEMDFDEVEDKGVQISDMERQMLRNEFLRTMQLRFLNGEDVEHFEYKQVDENVEYDSLDIRERDEEEKYFDDEDDEDIEGPNIHYLSQQMNDLKTASTGHQSRKLPERPVDSSVHGCSYSKSNVRRTCSWKQLESCTSDDLSCDGMSGDRGKVDDLGARQEADGAYRDTYYGGASHSQADTIDYEHYQVTKDVCPGLLKDERASARILDNSVTNKI